MTSLAHSHIEIYTPLKAMENPDYRFDGQSDRAGSSMVGLANSKPDN